MAREITIDCRYQKTYSTPENCRKAVEALGLPRDVRWMMLPAGDSKERFAPVIVLTARQTTDWIHLAHKGFTVVG